MTPSRRANRETLVRLLRLSLPVVRDKVSAVGAFWRRATGGLADGIEAALLAESDPLALPATDERPISPPVQPSAVVLSSQWMRMGQAKVAGYTPLVFAGTTYHIDREALLMWCRLAGIAVDYTADLEPADAVVVRQ